MIYLNMVINSSLLLLPVSLPLSIGQAMRVAENGVLGVEGYILLGRRNSLIASGEVERKFALRLSAIHAEYDIEEVVRAGTVVTHHCLGCFHNFGDSSRTLKVDVDDSGDSLVDGCLAGLFGRVELEGSRVLMKVSMGLGENDTQGTLT